MRIRLPAAVRPLGSVQLKLFDHQEGLDDEGREGILRPVSDSLGGEMEFFLQLVKERRINYELGLFDAGLLRGFRDADNILEGLEKEYFGKNDGTNEVN